MKYFAINFPDLMTFVVTTNSKLFIENVIHSLTTTPGFRGRSGAVYNPRQFVSVREISSPSDEQKTSARPITEVLL